MHAHKMCDDDGLKKDKVRCYFEDPPKNTINFSISSLFSTWIEIPKLLRNSSTEKYLHIWMATEIVENIF